LLAFAGGSALADTTYFGPDETVATPLDRMISVQFTDDAKRSDIKRAIKSVDATFEQDLAAPKLQQLSIPEGGSVTEAAIELRANPKVEFVSTPGRWQATADPELPTDAYFWTQWGLNNTGAYFACKPSLGAANVAPCWADKLPLSGFADADIDAPEAWEIATTGSEPVAVVDTGVAYQHTDLAANIFVNQQEATGVTGVDDDGDGLVDDIHGWDFTGDLNAQDVRQPPDNDPRDPDGHGTHVASILGAHSTFDTGTSEPGIAGVNPRAKIMPLRAADETGSFTWAAINQAVTYAIEEQGVRIINGSFGGPDTDGALTAIIDQHPEVLFVFSAGNGGDDHIGDNHDLGSTHHQYPCDIPADNIICVAATDWNDKLAKFSDYGYQSVDIAAPGAAIFGAWPRFVKWCHIDGVLVTQPPTFCSDDPVDHANDGLTGGIGDFRFLDGTSMATPMVSGAASLIWGAHPDLDASQIKTLLVENTDQLPALYGKVGFGGRLNVAKAALAAEDPPASGWPVAPPEPPPGPGEGGSDGDGTDDAPVNPTPPTTQPVPPIITDTTPPSYSVVTPKSARVGSVGKIRFRIHCREACSVKVLARADIAGVPALKAKGSLKANRSKTLTVQFRGKRLQMVRSLLDLGQTVKVYFSVTVTDGAGNHGSPRLFTVKLHE
jgi:subtilisin family serine protease